MNKVESALQRTTDTKALVIGSDALPRSAEMFKELFPGKRAIIVADKITYPLAGEAVKNYFDAAGIAQDEPHVYGYDDSFAEWTYVEELENVLKKTDAIPVAVGSGVINDIGKILSRVSGRHYIIVGTAPSMDGYASATSSMAMDGLKVSLNSRCPDAIVGDTDILKNAPMHMLQAGLGDMLAKYISLAEWRIAHLITGEYYCERVAALVRSALDACVKNADGLLRRDEAAVQAVFDGLIIGGVAMAYAGVSRPASGVEHYFSHVWDMRALEFGTPAELHGIQCAIGTLAAVYLYERLRTMTPDAEKARAYVEAFDYEAWAAQLRTFLGRSGETMIALEKREGKYRKDTHPARFARIQACWPEILRILDEELPSAEALSQLLSRLGMPQDASVIGVDTETMRLSFRATKDIRDKYVLSRLAWDLGVLDELCALL